MKPRHTIELDEYEVANLRAAIEAIGYPWKQGTEAHPLQVLNSGDWLGQIWLKLPEVAHLPNLPPEEYQRLARKAA